MKDPLESLFAFNLYAILFLGRLLIYVEYKFLINFEDTLDIDKFFLFINIIFMMF